MGKAQDEGISKKPKVNGSSPVPIVEACPFTNGGVANGGLKKGGGRANGHVHH